MTHLKPGDKAPDFSVLNENGDLINLKDYSGKKLVLFFIQKQALQAVLKLVILMKIMIHF